MKDKLKYLWIATTTSFLLSIQYIERYTDEHNRMLFFWQWWDGASIVFSAFLVGLLFYFAYLIADKFKKHKYIVKVVESAFIIIFGIAIVKNIEHWLFKVEELSLWLEIARSCFVYILYGLLLFALILHISTKSKRIRKIFITLCLIISPVIPIFLLTSFTYKTWNSTQGQLTYNDTGPNNIDKHNTFIFIFDEWSYQRSYRDKELIPSFENLKEFAKSSISFHNAYSPYQSSFQSLPNFIFQNNYTYKLKNNRLFFEKEEKQIIVNEAENIFEVPDKHGYFTALVGIYHPYADILAEEVDFINSVSAYKKIGTNFLGVTAYHILESMALYSFRFFPQTVKLVKGFCDNLFQLRRTSAIHQQVLSIINNVNMPTFALFHYPVPHDPFVYDRDGAKDNFQIYEWTVPNYMDNLVYLDKIIGEIVFALKHSGKYDNSLIIMTSDHSWRADPELPEDRNKPEHRHIPLFVKFPYQKETKEMDVYLSTSGLFEFIKQYR